MSAGEVASPPRELEGFRAYVRTWLSSRPIPRTAEDLDTRHDELRQWQRDLYAAGLIGITWPAAWGGQGLTVRHQQAFADELTRARAPQPIGLFGLDVVGPSIARFADDALRAALIPPMLSGEHIWCQGFSEPEAGSDLAALKTTARREGDEFVLTGQKTWTSWAHKAHWCAVLARTDPDLPRHRGISYLVVDMASPGISVRPITQITGESEFGEVFFDEVRVPVANLVGELNGGWRIAMDTLAHERGTYALRRRVEIRTRFADAVSAMRGRVAEERVDVPDAVVQRIGAGEVALRALRAQTSATMRRIAEHGEPSAMDSIDKLVLTQAEQTVFGALKDVAASLATIADADAIGLHTGIVTRDYLYARAGSIYGGSAQIQRNIVAERLLGLPR